MKKTILFGGVALTILLATDASAQSTTVKKQELQAPYIKKGDPSNGGFPMRSAGNQSTKKSKMKPTNVSKDLSMFKKSSKPTDINIKNMVRTSFKPGSVIVSGDTKSNSKKSKN